MLRSASGDTILVPACEVTADFGGTAAINVKVATGSGAPIVHRMEWPVEPRLLAFHRKGEEAPISTLDWGEDSLIGDIYVCVHLPPTDGAAVGPIDEQFSWGGRVEVRESGKPSTHKLTLTGPRTETWSVAAPTKKQKTKTLTARLANAVASLVISGTQGPPAGFKLELDTKHVVAGKPFVLRAIVVDAGGQPYQTRPGQQLPGCRSANGLAVLANGQPRKLRVLATSRNSNEEAEEQLALVSPWVPGQATGQADAVVLVCTLVIKRSGKYAIAVDGVEALLQVEQARSSAGAQFEVLAAAPAALRLEWDDEDGSPVRQVIVHCPLPHRYTLHYFYSQLPLFGSCPGFGPVRIRISLLSRSVTQSYSHHILKYCFLYIHSSRARPSSACARPSQTSSRTFARKRTSRRAYSFCGPTTAFISARRPRASRTASSR
ncbi:hypothetical protein T492DRAFT_480897 [Pavlovales sp. CCMP2436]|nr:hypothetical protein T492DRAFT_480897 [Pavlovales sp. CCMP2436]